MAERAPRQDPMVFENPEARMSWEREHLAEGDAAIAAGRVLSGQAATDGLDRWAAGEAPEEPKFDWTDDRAILVRRVFGPHQDRSTL